MSDSCASSTLLEQFTEQLNHESKALARRLFEGGSVMGITRPSRRVVEARVANEQGHPEQVRIMFSHNGLLSACSCGKSKGGCAHAAALLYHLDRQQALEAYAQEPGSPALTTPRAAWHPRAGTAPHSLAELAVSATRPRPVLRLTLDTPPAPGLLRAEAPFLLATAILLNDRDYGPANIRKLVEDGEAAGGMLWEDFIMPARQAMLFLATHGKLEKTGFSLPATEFADLLQLLRGYAELHGPQGRLTIHAAEAKAVLHLAAAANAAPGADGSPAPTIASPGFTAADGTPLPADALTVVPGRNGHWLSCHNQFHWFHAALEPGWLRFFLAGKPESLPAETVTRLLNHGLLATVAVREETPAADATAAVEPCFQPVLCLDWHCGQIAARLEFDYDGIRVPPDDEELVRTPQRTIPRRGRRERKAQETLLALGFIPEAAAAGGQLRLADPDLVWDFWRQGQETLPADWQLFLSTSYIRTRASATLLNLDLAPAAESSSWFDLDCRLLSDTGKPLPWKKIAAAVRAGLETVLVDGDTLVHIPEQVRVLVALLEHGAEGHGPHSDGKFRFPLFQAPALHQAFAAKLGGARTHWLELARRLSQPPPPDPEMFSPELTRILRGYQKDGVAWLRLLDECGFHGILADEMGLGKTVQALAWLAWRRRTGAAKHPALIVCPSSLLENWRNETTRFVPEFRPLVVHGLDRGELLNSIPDHDVIITSYALLRRDAKTYRAMTFDAMILDEAQHIKNPQTANAQTCKLIHAEHRLILTGTPLENSIRELWSLFDFLLPGYLGSRQAFRHRYETAEPNSPVETDARRELALRIRPFLLRRLKADVCQELPPKIEQLLYCEMEPAQWKLYTTFLMAGRQMLQQSQDGWQNQRFQVLAMLTRLRQACCHPELLPAELSHGFGQAAHQSAKTELLKEVLLETLDSGHRVAVFSQFTSFLKLFRPWLEQEGIPYEYLDGSTTDRQARVDRFNRDPKIPIFLLSLKAGGTGLNLTGADTVIHYDQWWNPMVEDQATDRTHRIGQTRQVTALKLIVRNTIEEKIHALQQRKRVLFNQMMAGAPGRAGELTREDVEFLLGDGDAPHP